MIIFCQFYSHMLAISRGEPLRRSTETLSTLPFTFYAAYQLALGIRWALEVQTTHSTITTHRLVVLAEMNTMPQNRSNLFFKLSLAEILEEVATSLTEEAWLNDENAFNFCFDYIHCLVFLRK